MDSMLTLMQIAALATAGMCFALLGSVKLPLARKLEIDEGKVGGLVSVFGFTLIPMVVAAGFLVDLLGKQSVLGGGFALVILSLIVLAHSRHYAAALLAVLVLGTGWSALVNVLNVTSPPAFVPPEDLPQRMAYAMNMGDFIFGMGTFVTPLIIVYCAHRMGLVRTLYGFAAVSVIPLLLGLGVDWEALKVAATDSVAGGLAKLLSDPIVWICSIAFFFHVPTEAAIATWATTLMTDKNVSEAKSSTLLSAFWLTFMGSRLVTALTLPVGADTTLVVVMACCSIAITLSLVICRGATLMCVLIVVSGAVVGPIFPTLIAILLGHVEPSLHGRAVGIFFCIGGIGWTAIPILIGMYAKRTTVQRGFLIASGSAVLLCAFSIVLALRLR
jgi:fucose permease